MASVFFRALKRATPILRPKMRMFRSFFSANRIPTLAIESKKSLRKVGFLCGVVAASQSLPIDNKEKGEPQKNKLALAADPERLTFSFLIKQAASHTVDAATGVLTQAASAILENEKKYRDDLRKVIKLMEYHHATLGTSDENRVWDQIVTCRSESECTKRKINEMESFYKSATQLMEAAAETALHADCEYGSAMASERLQSANSELECSRDKTKELEKMYLELYSKIIRDTVCE